MKRDHMMGFIQPNYETHGPAYKWNDAYPLGYPEQRRHARQACWAKEIAKEDAVHRFNTGDHQPDGTVRPAATKPCSIQEIGSFLITGGTLFGRAASVWQTPIFTTVADKLADVPGVATPEQVMAELEQAPSECGWIKFTELSEPARKCFYMGAMRGQKLAVQWRSGSVQTDTDFNGMCWLDAEKVMVMPDPLPITAVTSAREITNKGDCLVAAADATSYPTGGGWYMVTLSPIEAGDYNARWKG